jgi:hypothetical protein
MHRTVAAVAFVAILGVTAVASAQQQNNPISYEAISKAKSGQWADYTMSMKGQAQSIKMRYAVVERSDKQMVLELESTMPPPMGQVVMHMQYSNSGDAWNMSRAMVLYGEQKKFLTAEELKTGEIKKGDLPGQLVGTEAVTVPGGKFEAKHYTRKVMMPGSPTEQRIDVWMSDKAGPTGLVRMSAENGVEAVLSATGSDAKAKLSFDAAPATDKTDKTDKTEKTDKSEKKPAKPQKQ